MFDAKNRTAANGAADEATTAIQDGSWDTAAV
jgi:hypothetical protein